MLQCINNEKKDGAAVGHGVARPATSLRHIKPRANRHDAELQNVKTAR